MFSGRPAPQGIGVLHESDVGGAARFAIVGRDQRIVEKIGTVPHPAGAQLTFNDVQSRWVAFIYTLTNGDDAASRWDLYLFDRRAHVLRLIAHNPRDRKGHALQGSFVHPVLTDRYLYWIQAAQTHLPWGGSEIEQYDLLTRRTRTVYRGLAEALVPLGTKLIFTGVGPGADRSRSTAPLQTLAVDQVGGHLEPAPAGITAAADGADTIRQDAGVIVWDTSRGGLRAWSSQWGHSVTLVPNLGDWSLGDRLQMTGVSYPAIYGHFVVFHSGDSYVLDLRTDVFTAITTRASGIDLSGSMVEVEQYASKAKSFSPPYRLDQTVIDLAKLPDLGPCAR